jgi:hypothetical protein
MNLQSFTFNAPSSGIQQSIWPQQQSCKSHQCPLAPSQALPSVHTYIPIPRKLVAEDDVPEGGSFSFFKKVIRDRPAIQATIIIGL